MENKRYWESQFVDLNLRRYDGKPSDVFKNVQKQILNFLQGDGPTQKQREIYSAIYNAINLYQEITYLPGADYNTDNTYLSYTIKYFNEDFNYLAKLYNTEQNPNTITALARIKSPIKYIEKVLEKVDEYDEEGRDFQYFNESLRDIIGVKFVVDPPKQIKEQGKDAESDFFYEVFYKLAKFRGINNPDDEELSFGQYKFLKVNTRYDPYKQVRLKTRPDTEGFDDELISKLEPAFYHPEHRPTFMDRNNIDSKVKDYHRYPKFKGYQGVHTCVIPDYAFSLEHREIPECIIPPYTRNYAIEYQFRTKDEDNHAEYGIASHEKIYKPGEKDSFHRLLVPFFIAFSDPEDMPEKEETDATHSSTTNVHDYYKHTGNVLKLRNYGESFRKYYRTSFESYYGIPFKTFRDTFTTEEKNAILAGKVRVQYDKKTKRYYTTLAPKYLFCTQSSSNEIASLLRYGKEDSSNELLDKLGLTDGVYQIYSDPKGEVFSRVETTRCSIKAFTLRKMSLEEKEEFKNQQISQNETEIQEEKERQHSYNKDEKRTYQDENLPEY